MKDSENRSIEIVAKLVEAWWSIDFVSVSNFVDLVVGNGKSTKNTEFTLGLDRDEIAVQIVEYLHTTHRNDVLLSQNERCFIDGSDKNVVPILRILYTEFYGQNVISKRPVTKWVVWRLMMYAMRLEIAGEDDGRFVNQEIDRFISELPYIRIDQDVGDYVRDLLGGSLKSDHPARRILNAIDDAHRQSCKNRAEAIGLARLVST